MLVYSRQGVRYDGMSSLVSRHVFYIDLVLLRNDKISLIWLRQSLIWRCLELQALISVDLLYSPI
jgi:hypothetical protein